MCLYIHFLDQVISNTTLLKDFSSSKFKPEACTAQLIKIPYLFNRNFSECLQGPALLRPLFVSKLLGKKSNHQRLLKSKILK